VTSFVFSIAAENDLIEIYRYGTLNYGQEQAELYVHGIKDKCQLVADTPELCRERKEFKPPVRIYNYKSHLIIYILKEKFILVVRILHARMDLVSEPGWATHDLSIHKPEK